MHDYINLTDKTAEHLKLKHYEMIGCEMQLLANSIDESPKAFGALDASIFRDIAFMAMGLAMILDAKSKTTIH